MFLKMDIKKYIQNPNKAKVLVTCNGRIPSLELGAIIPFSELNKKGLCDLRYKDDMLISLQDIAWCDILFMVRATSNQSLRVAKFAKKLKRILLGYWDDNFLKIPKYSLTYKYFSNEKIKGNIEKLFALTDTFFSPNDKLAKELAEKSRKPSKILPGLHGAEVFYPPKLNKSQVPVIGYSGGQDHLKIVNNFLGTIFYRMEKMGKAYQIHIVGPKPEFYEQLKVKTIYTKPIHDYYEYLTYSKTLHWDIGLAPQWEDEFTTYKFYNKFLEYTYLGCPGIYTKIEPYVGIVEDGITGLLVPNEIEAWVEAILRLLKDPDLRYKLAFNAYEYVQSHHNRHVVIEKYAEVLAPFLSYRAPYISERMLYLYNPLFQLSNIYQTIQEYIKVNGLKRFLKRAPVYVLKKIKKEKKQNWY